MFRCNVWKRNISCAHQGEADVKRHVLTDTHQKLYKAQNQQMPAVAVFGNYQQRQQEIQLKEEVGLTVSVVKHIPYSILLLYIVKGLESSAYRRLSHDTAT